MRLDQGSYAGHAHWKVCPSPTLLQHFGHQGPFLCLRKCDLRAQLWTCLRHLLHKKSETSCTQPLNYLPKEKPMLLQGSGGTSTSSRYIDGDKGESSANLVHLSLEKAGHTTRLKWHASEFVQAHIGSGRKSSLGSITGMNWKLQYPYQAYGKNIIEPASRSWTSLGQGRG